MISLYTFLGLYVLVFMCCLFYFLVKKITNEYDFMNFFLSRDFSIFVYVMLSILIVFAMLEVVSVFCGTPLIVV